MPLQKVKIFRESDGFFLLHRMSDTHRSVDQFRRFSLKFATDSGARVLSYSPRTEHDRLVAARFFADTLL